MSKLSIDFAKENYKKVISENFSTDKFPSSSKPISIFMAGSPGSGKTEFARGLIVELEKIDPDNKIIHLDTDELRSYLPEYTGKNSSHVQSAATLLFDKIFDSIHRNCQNAIIDTTFSSPRSLDNVSRALNRNRSVGISYLYQDPYEAWKYTKYREKLEGRHVPKSVFIDAFYKSLENVEKTKFKFGNSVSLDIYVKKSNNSFEKSFFNTNSIKNYIPSIPKRSVLERSLNDIV